MNKYIGKICPYCKAAFTEDDEIVVCSDCEMPHHKDCWIDNKGCTTFGCQGTIQGIEIEVDTSISSAPKYEVRDAESQPIQEQPAFCSRCGSPLVAGNAFCSKCGAPVAVAVPQPAKTDYAQKLNEVTSKVSAELKSAMEEYRTSDTMDPELSKYIGSKSEYYLNVFSTLKSTKKYNSWNWFESSEHAADSVIDPVIGPMVEAEEIKSEESSEETIQTDNTDLMYFKPYIVQPGDSLLSICNAVGIDYYSTYRVILAASGIDNANEIFVGQTIMLPVRQ